jgi:radical SAM-linked protein
MREERGGFLEKLGALEPTRRDTAPTERDRAQDRFRRGLTPRVMAHGARARYRLRYTKLGAVALFGHLDMVRKVPRVFARAGVALCYSEGFHPKPILQFTPALALGIASVAEYVDVLLVERQAPEALVARLNAASPEGLRWLGAVEVPEGQPKLSKVLAAQDYLLTVSDPWLVARFGASEASPRAELEALCAEALEREHLVVERAAKGGARPERRDIRGMLGELCVLHSTEWPALLPLDNAWGLRVRLLLENAPSVRPVELGRALLGVEPSHADIARLAIWADFGDGLAEPLALPATGDARVGASGGEASVSRETLTSTSWASG